MPPTKATPMTVPINNPVTKTGCSLINGTPRPASQATKMPIRTAAIILKLINSETGGIWIYRNQRAQYADGQQDDAQMQTVFFHQGNVLRQSGLLHQQ